MGWEWPSAPAADVVIRHDRHCHVIAAFPLPKGPSSVLLGNNLGDGHDQTLLNDKVDSNVLYSQSRATAPGTAIASTDNGHKSCDNPRLIHAR